jgi:DNA-directed RNA polymerase subunit RPC12/RpoP
MSSYYTCTDCGRLYRLNITKDPDNMTVYVCRKCNAMICKDCLERAGRAAPQVVCPRCGTAGQWKPEWAVFW